MRLISSIEGQLFLNEVKMKIERLLITILIFAFLSSYFTVDAFAQSPIRKLGRGLANVLTGFLELPAGIVDAAEEEGYIAAVSYGVVKGLAMSLLRTGVGLYETVTFLIPLPFRYEPIIEPEFLMSDENF